MNKNISWKNLLYIAVICFALKLVFHGGVIAFGLEVIGLISLVSGIAGYVKHRKLIKNNNIK